jgi:hypothetical protein
MPDTKTSDESSAAALSGSELIRGVQGGANVKITAAQIATLANSSTRAVASCRARPAPGRAAPSPRSWPICRATGCWPVRRVSVPSRW